MEGEPTHVLVLGYGNPGRLDDGLAPALVESLEGLELAGVTLEADYQLTLEDAAEAARHDAVVFVDAALDGPEPFAVAAVEPAPPRSQPGFTSHAVQPADVLGWARDIFDRTPHGWLVAIRGYEFDAFGERLSELARENLAATRTFLLEILRAGDLRELRARCAPRTAGPARQKSWRS